RRDERVGRGRPDRDGLRRAQHALLDDAPALDDPDAQVRAQPRRGGRRDGRGGGGCGGEGAHVRRYCTARAPANARVHASGERRAWRVAPSRGGELLPRGATCSRGEVSHPDGFPRRTVRRGPASPNGREGSKMKARMRWMILSLVALSAPLASTASA